MQLQYELKEGAYHLYDMSSPTEHRHRTTQTCACAPTNVAIAFDASTGQLHEHGSPLRIQSWASNTRRRLRSSGDDGTSQRHRGGIRSTAC